jgi:site-specific recombinase XerD
MPAFKNRLFVNQRRQGFTRSGVYRICQSCLKKALPESRLKDLNAAHCFRHSCAIDMLMNGSPLSDIKNHLGHEDINSTMIYFRLDLSRRREVQKRFIEYTETILKNDPKIDELIDWENNKDEIVKWLDSL